MGNALGKERPRFRIPDLFGFVTESRSFFFNFILISIILCENVEKEHCRVIFKLGLMSRACPSCKRVTPIIGIHVRLMGPT